MDTLCQPNNNTPQSSYSNALTIQELKTEPPLNASTKNIQIPNELENLSLTTRQKNQKKWRELHPNAHREYYLKNKEILLQKSKIYNLKNKIKIREYEKKYNLENREKVRQRGRRHDTKNKLKKKEYRLIKKYGITLNDYNSLLLKQNGCCKICCEPHKENKTLAVDHCHKTGKVRGLLCHHCNTAIGLLKENPIFLNNAINYLM
jgi:hypothetical protein